MGKMIELTAADGHRLAAYRADPAGKPRGAIVVIQEIFGVNSHVRSVADGFAAEGYVAIAPAMFDRVQRNFDVGYCWGGFVAWMASAKVSGLSCAVPYYGGGILDNTDIEPKVPVMGHFGEKDSMIPVAGGKKLARKEKKNQNFL